MILSLWIDNHGVGKDTDEDWAELGVLINGTDSTEMNRGGGSVLRIWDGQGRGGRGGGLDTTTWDVLIAAGCSSCVVEETCQWAPTVRSLGPAD